MSYFPGNIIRLVAEFKNAAGVLVAPDAVQFRILAPGAEAPSVVAGTELSLGVYYADVAADVSGIWKYKATGSGAVVAAVEAFFEVSKPIADFGG